MAFGLSNIPVALSVNESQPGGSGLLADIRTFSALGTYPLGVVTAAVAELGGQRSMTEALSSTAVAAQLSLALEQHVPGVVKLGALHGVETAEAAAAVLQEARRTRNGLPVVVRPALRTRSGQARVSVEAQGAAEAHCFPLASLLVCSAADAKPLAGLDVTQQEHLEPAAKTLGDTYSVPVLVTGGRLQDTEESIDCLWDGQHLEFFASPRVMGVAPVGLGDVLTAAIGVYLMNGFGPADAVAQAKTYLEQALGYAVPIGPELLMNPAFGPHPLEPQ